MIIFLLFLNMARGDSLEGRVFTDLHFPQRQNQNKVFNQAYVGSWLGYSKKLEEWKAYGQIEAYIADKSNSAVPLQKDFIDADVREAYLSTSQSGWDWTFGKFMTVWGKTDGFSPMDVLTAKNMALFNHDEEVKRKGGIGGKLTLHPDEGGSPVTVHAVVHLFYPRGDFNFPLPSNVTVSSAQYDPVIQDKSLSNLEWAVKADYNGDGWDSSIMVFDGFEHVPYLKLESFSGSILAPQIALKKYYNRQMAFGWDGSYGFERFVLKGELVYFRTVNREQNAMETPPYYFSVVGVETPITDRIRFLGQVAYRYFPEIKNYQEAPGANIFDLQINREIARYNMLIHGSQTEQDVMTLARVSWTNEDLGMEGEMNVLYNLQGKDNIIRPKISYLALTDLRLTAGLDLYGGPATRTWGAMGPYSSYFFEARFLF